MFQFLQASSLLHFPWIFLDKQTQTRRPYSFVTKWGSLGEGDGQFDGQNDVDLYNGRVYVADYANHRIQIF